jgi:hypothetical protein
MEKMSTTKRLSVKAVKPQDQIFASKMQTITEAILDEKTTELSDAIDSAVYNSIMFGSATLKMEGGSVTTTPYHGPSISSLSTSNHKFYPRPSDVNRETLESHPAFELTVEQLRAAWMLTYGNRWVSMDEASCDDYMEKVSMRLKALGELEVHNVIDQYAPMARIKV